MIDVKARKVRILVVGDLIIDHYLWGICDRISPEAPVQVVNIERETSVSGGAGNVVNNLVSMGAHTDIISVIGDCESSEEVMSLLAAIKVDTKYLVTEKARRSSKKTRIIAAQQQVVRFDRESSHEIKSETEDAITALFEDLVCQYDVILLSDYGKGLFTNSLTRGLIEIANQNDKKILIDPKGSDYSKYTGAYCRTQ